MKWYVVEVQDNVLRSKPLQGTQHRLLINEKWEVKPEQRSTDQIIEAAVTKYPAAESRYTSRFFGGFREAWLSTLDRAAGNFLRVPEEQQDELDIEIVAEIRI